MQIQTVMYIVVLTRPWLALMLVVGVDGWRIYFSESSWHAS